MNETRCYLGQKIIKYNSFCPKYYFVWCPENNDSRRSAT